MLDGGVISGPVSIATIGSAVATTLKISQVVYELKAVGEQARDLLDSTQFVNNNLSTARALRRQKSVHLDVHEKKWIDSVFTSTDKTLSNVAALIEPARVDMQTKFGSVGFLNRGLFVFRDSPKIPTHLARLAIASSSLDSVLNVLCSRDGRPTLLSPKADVGGWPDPNRLRRKSCASMRSEESTPPAYQYQETEFLSRGYRSSHAQRKQQMFGTEMKESVMADPPAEQPLCSASWAGSTAQPTTYTTLELEGSYVMSPSSWYPDKGPTIQVQEITELESPYHSRVHSMAVSSVPSIRPRNSMSSIRTTSTAWSSDGSRFSVISDASSQSSGRNRGRAWMAHQATR